MRVKTKYCYTHFGVTFKTNKADKLSLDSFLARDYKLTSDDYLAFLWNSNKYYKLYDRAVMLEYFNNLKDECNNTKHIRSEARKRMINRLCDKSIEFLTSSDFDVQQLNYRTEMYEKICPNHRYSFGEFVNVRIPHSLERTLELYDFRDSFYKPYYTNAFYDHEDKYLIKNYELNMKHFESLSKKEFLKSVEDFIKEYRTAKFINDLNEKECEMPGWYILILDEYKQVYIGETRCIRKRIVEHFSKTKKYNRRIFGGVEKSKISIDSFGCRDITRIIIIPDYFESLKEGFSHEQEFLDCFDNKFVTNRVNGGELPFGLESAEVKTITD